MTREEACAVAPQTGFCVGETYNDAWRNNLTLSVPKGGNNREHKARLNIGGVLSTRPGTRPRGLMGLAGVTCAVAHRLGQHSTEAFYLVCAVGQLFAARRYTAMYFSQFFSTKSATREDVALKPLRSQ